MAENTISMTLSQLVDLSLCSTEMGTVNFSILHALLQVLLQQVSRSDLTVEFVGKDSDRIQDLLKVAKPQSSLTLTEYKVVGDKRIEKTGDDAAGKSVVVVKQKGPTIPQFSVTITKEQFTKIETDIKTIKEQLTELKDLPGNLDLIEATRDKNSPILDMFQIISVNKRVDAVETSLEKIASLIEDLINGAQYKKGKAIRDTVKNVRSSIDSMIRDEIGKIITRAEDIAEHVDSKTLLEESIKSELERIVSKIEESYEETSAPKKATPIPDNINVRINELSEKVDELTKKVDELAECVDNSKIFTEITDRLNVDQTKIRELYDSLKDVLNQIQTLKDISNKLTEEMDTYKKNYEAIVEQIDFLKITKANHEDLQEALETKADTCEVNKKVSTDVFEQTCGEFSKAIEDTANKLTQLEQFWLQALENIQQDLGNKLDKAEFDALKEFINNHLKEIQEKLKYLESLKQKPEAAGTKKKLLKDINCISCDEDVLMRKDMDPSLKATGYGLPPPAKNIAPYIAYELDQLRTQEKIFPGTKNLSHLEAALKMEKESKRHDHICNRYCGGSHTVTTAEQRVTRVGHFTQQWGVKVGALLDDKYIRGVDNHMYKADPEVDKMKRPSTAINERSKPSKHSIIQAETVTARQKSNKKLLETDNVAPAPAAAAPAPAPTPTPAPVDVPESAEDNTTQANNEELTENENEEQSSHESVQKPPSQESNTIQQSE